MKTEIWISKGKLRSSNYSWNFFPSSELLESDLSASTAVAERGHAQKSYYISIIFGVAAEVEIVKGDNKRFFALPNFCLRWFTRRRRGSRSDARCLFVLEHLDRKFVICKLRGLSWENGIVRWERAEAGKIEGESQVSTLNLQINSPWHMIMEDDMRLNRWRKGNRAATVTAIVVGRKKSWDAAWVDWAERRNRIPRVPWKCFVNYANSRFGTINYGSLCVALVGCHSRCVSSF